LRARDIKESIINVIESGENLPLHIWGSAGIGKSDTVRQAAKELGIGLKDVRMTLLDPTDLRGIPIPRGDTAYWLQPVFLPNVERDGERGILFLDELNAAPPLVQASGYQLVLDREIGEYKLPKGWVIMAAGNNAGDGGVTHRMPSPLANRFIHLDFEVSIEDWTAWAMKSDISLEVIGFLNFRVGQLNNFDAKRDKKAFPTPRSWAYVSNLMDFPDSIRYAMITGTVGEGSAAEFIAYLNVYRDLPDLDRILNGGNEKPQDRGLMYATITGLTAKAKEEHINHLIDYLLLYDPEFAVMGIQMLLPNHKKAIVQSETFRNKFARTFKEILV
jgi:hypothetical protein